MWTGQKYRPVRVKMTSLFHTRLEELNSCLLDSRSFSLSLSLSLSLNWRPTYLLAAYGGAAAFSSLLVPCSMHLLFPYFISDLRLLLRSPNQEASAPTDRDWRGEDFLRESYYF